MNTRFFNFLMTLMLFSVISYAQTDSFNDEDKFIFKNVVQYNQGLDMVPEINWPIEAGSDDYYKFRLKLTESDFSRQIIQFDKKHIADVKIIEENGLQYLQLKTDFPPQNEKKLAMALYSIGVENVNLNGELISIYKYVQAYKRAAAEGLRNTRTYEN